MTEGRLPRHHVLAHEHAQDNTCKSGVWGRMQKILPRVIDAGLHLHEKQCAETWPCGRITDRAHAASHPGRITFTFMPDKTVKPTTTTRWGVEQARVWDDCDHAGNT